MNILLADDHNIVRNGIKLLLESEKNFVVRADTLSEHQILEKVSREEVDLVIVELETPTIDGISLTKQIKQINSNVKVFILTAIESREHILTAFLAGVDGYMLKNAKPDELIFSLKYIQEGGKYLCAELTMKLLAEQLQHINNQSSSKNAIVDFSLRETEILQLIAEGLTNSEMSDKLFISKRTIEGHRQSLLEKTGSKNTAALMRFAIRNQIIQ